MSERHLFCDSIPDLGESVSLSPEEALHGVRVLRLRQGEFLWLLDGRGTVAEARVEDCGAGRRVQLACRVLHAARMPEPAIKVRLCVAPPRATKQMTHIIRQATELGVWRITPVVCEFSVARPAGDIPEHWHAEAKAAAKQSGNAYLPGIDPPLSFDAAIDRSPGAGIFGAVPGDPSDRLPSLPSDGEMDVWIGPEGGFSDGEKTRLAASGLIPVAIGHWTLRVETAVPALAGWLSAQGVL